MKASVKIVLALIVSAVLLVSYFMGKKPISVDMFDDYAISTSVINIRQLPVLRARLKPGYPVKIGFKSSKQVRFILKEVQEEGLLGTGNEVALFKDIEYVEYISEDDLSAAGRLAQGFLRVLAAIAAAIMWAASSIGSIFS